MYIYLYQNKYIDGADNFSNDIIVVNIFAIIFTKMEKKKRVLPTKLLKYIQFTN